MHPNQRNHDSSFPDSQSQRSQTSRSDRSRPQSFSNARNAKRSKPNGTVFSPQIASRRKFSANSPARIDESPSLSNLRAQMQSIDRSFSLWDRAPQGLEFVNAQVLKLFNLAQPNTNFGNLNLPPEVSSIRDVKSLRPENSRMFRTLEENGREQVYGDVIAASNRVAEMHGAIERPHPLPMLQIADPPSGLENHECVTTLVEPTAIVVYNAANLEAIETKYQSKPKKHYSLTDQIWAVKFDPPVSPQDGDIFLFTPPSPQSSCIPFIEILNAFPIQKSSNSSVPYITGLLKRICSDLNSGPVDSILVNNGRKIMDKPRWVTISLADPSRVEDVARKLGEITVQGRPLVTTVRYVHSSPIT